MRKGLISAVLTVGLLCLLVFPISASDYIGVAKIFTFNCVDLNTRAAASNSLQHLWEMGYDAGEFLNNGASSGYSTFPSSNIFVVSNHGGAGRIRFDTSSTTLTRLYGNSFSSIASTSRAISTYSSNELSSVLFAAFIGCKTGLTDRTYGNLVDAALDKGVDCAIGWNNETYPADTSKWIGLFFEECANSGSISDALEYADYWLQFESCIDYDSVCDRYIGDSDTSIYLG